MVSPAGRLLSQSLLARLQEAPPPDTAPITLQPIGGQYQGQLTNRRAVWGHLSSQSRGWVKVMRMVQVVTSSCQGPRVTCPAHCPASSLSTTTHSSAQDEVREILI